MRDSEFLLQRNQNNLKTSQKKGTTISLEVEQAVNTKDRNN